MKTLKVLPIVVLLTFLFLTTAGAKAECPLEYGNRYYIQNGYNNWESYLDTCGGASCGGNMYRVITSSNPDRAASGTGTWEIISASGKPAGSPVLIGDKMHLKNLYGPGSYLDTCGGDSCGGNMYDVSTSSSTNRASKSGTWEIISASGKPVGSVVYTMDPIYLKNLYGSGTYLDTCGAGSCGDCAKYDVSTSSKMNRAENSGTWRFVPSYYSSNTVYSLETQFNGITGIKNALGFNLGAFKDTINFSGGTSMLPCKHLQGMARIQSSDGTPYFFFTRSGNPTAACADAPNTPGELWTVRMGSRNKDGGILGSNRTVTGAPPESDKLVRIIKLDGKSKDERGNVWPGWMHPGGVQIIDGVLVAPCYYKYEPISWGTSTLYDSGSRLAVAMDDNGNCIEVHQASMGNDHYYHVGKMDFVNKKITWGASTKYDTGSSLAVAMDNNGNCIEVHRASMGNDHYYRVGKVDFTNKKINWGASTKYDTRSSLAVAMDNNGNCIEVHRASKGNDHYYRVGKVDFANKKINWAASIHYDTGSTVAISMDNKCNYVEIHQESIGNKHYYLVGSSRCQENLIGGLMLVDVTQPEKPAYIKTISSFGSQALGEVYTVGVTKIMSGQHRGKYLFLVGDVFGLSNVTNLRDPNFTVEFLCKLATPPNTQYVWGETVNFVWDTNCTLYLISFNNSSSDIPECGESWAYLYKLNLDYIKEIIVTPISKKLLSKDTSTYGDAKAEAAVYVTPTGKLVLYMGCHSNYDVMTRNDYIKMGEFASK